MHDKIGKVYHSLRQENPISTVLIGETQMRMFCRALNWGKCPKTDKRNTSLCMYFHEVLTLQVI